MKRIVSFLNMEYSFLAILIASLTSLRLDAVAESFTNLFKGLVLDLLPMIFTRLVCESEFKFIIQ